MAGVHPCVDAYLARLPDGLASYPECLAKASLLRNHLEARPFDMNADDVHEGLRPFLFTPPPVSSWIPEVVLTTTTLTIYAKRFGGTDVAGFEQWIYTHNIALFRKPLYRMLVALTSPARLLVGMAKRWSAFHRGSNITLLESDDNAALVELTFPPQLFGAESLHAFAAAARAAVTVAGGRDVLAHIDVVTATRAVYGLRWKVA